MSKHCPKYGCTVLYADCLECDDKICKKENTKRFPKYNVGDTLYIVYECSKYNIIILKANISCIKIYKEKISYSFNNVKVEHDKFNCMNGKSFPLFGIVDENQINVNNDLLKKLEVSYPIFTTKEKCKEYLRRKVKTNEKQNRYRY